MLTTRITRRFGLATPILNAGMAMIARPPLAAAVSNAGALGMIGCDVSTPDALRAMIRETKALTDRAFGVDLIGDFLSDDHIDVLVDEKVPLAVFFWTPPTPAQMRRLQRSGTEVWMQVGSVAEAAEAVPLGVEGLVVQGAEAGGHNRSEASTMTLFPRVRTLYPELPLVAAGGIADGRTLAAALCLGADAVWCGTRFLAAEEANACEAYKRRVEAADVGDTAIYGIYGPEWPEQPMRAILNEGLRAALGREADAVAEARGEVMGTVTLSGERVPLPRYSAILPMRDFEGDIEQACLTAGQSAGNIREILPAALIVRQMSEEAEAVLTRSAATTRATSLRDPRRESPPVPAAALSMRSSARWGLKADYPMVAPNYAKKRQELAKKIGLGRKPKQTEPAPKARSPRSRKKAAA